MAQQSINIGTTPNDGTGDPLRTAGQKINSNFNELYSSVSTANAAANSASASVSTVNQALGAHINNANPHAHGVGGTIDGQGSVISTGIAGEFQCPVNGTIVEAYLVGDQTGDIVIDIWKAARTIPSGANSICAALRPTLSAGRVWSSTALTGWTTSVGVGDIFIFNVVSVATVTRVTLTLRIV